MAALADEGAAAKRKGVAASALRYWEELGLLPVPGRVGGRRRYPSSTVSLVGEILVLQDAGYTLREIEASLAARARPADGWRELTARKPADLDERIAQVQAARTAIACPTDDIRACPNFVGVVAARLTGADLREAHRH